MKARIQIYRFTCLFFLSYGLFYFSYKWLDPTRFNADFVYYYPMVLHPFNFSVAPSPWVYRQFSTVIALVLWRLHIYYPDLIQFHDPQYDQRIYFAMLLTNYLGVMIAACVAATMTDDYLRETGIRSEFYPLVAGILCFFSFYLQQVTLTGQTDGMNWALFALGYLFWSRRQLAPLAIVLLVSIVQREILPLVFLCFSAIKMRSDRFQRGVAAISIGVFALYLTMKHFVHAPGHEFQTEPGAMFHALISYRPTVTYFMQVFMGQNLMFVMVAFWLLLFRRTRRVSANILTLPAVCAMLLLLSIATQIGASAGRMLAMLTPLVAFEIASGLATLDHAGLLISGVSTEKRELAPAVEG